MTATDAGRSVSPPPRGGVSVLIFFGLTFFLTVPIWVMSAASGRELMPGLPVGAFAVVCPAVAAFVVACAGGG